ncbi:uncharacterized protein LOC141855970 [Brevipalpus obovatus]|uniref:uncharacterized protein LOC141855970 n=1 Tax=Brevipalpus obovatus TaxID=246614 RepID=UPI003D9F3AC2
MIFKFHLCLIVVLFTLSEGYFHESVIKDLDDYFNLGKYIRHSKLELYPALDKLAEFCEIQKKSEESADAKSTAKKFLSGEVEYYDGIEKGQKILSECRKAEKF